MAVTNTCGPSNCCSETVMRMSWMNIRRRVVACGNKSEHLLGADTRQCKWNWRVFGRVFNDSNSLSRSFITKRRTVGSIDVGMYYITRGQTSKIRLDLPLPRIHPTIIQCSGYVGLRHRSRWASDFTSNKISDRGLFLLTSESPLVSLTKVIGFTHGSVAIYSVYPHHV